jgi:hypothetical protein
MRDGSQPRECLEDRGASVGVQRTGNESNANDAFGVSEHAEVRNTEDVGEDCRYRLAVDAELEARFQHAP